MTNAERNGHPWTRRDLKELRRLAAEGLNAALIAEKLDRTPVGIKSKALALGLVLTSRRRVRVARADVADLASGPV